MDLVLLQFFLLYPFIGFLTNKERFWNRKTRFSGFFLCIGAILILSFLSYNRAPNLYDELGIQPKSEKSGVQAAYRKLSLKLHPDARNHGASLHKDAAFRRISAANAVLSSPTKRTAYHRFGDLMRKASSADEGYDWFSTNNPKVETDAFFMVCFGVVFRSAFGLFMEQLFVLRSGKNYDRRFYLAFLGIVTSLEVLLRFSPEPDAVFSMLPFVNKLLPFEQIAFFECFSTLFHCLSHIKSASFSDDFEPLRMALKSGDFSCMIASAQISFYKRLKLLLGAQRPARESAAFEAVVSAPPECCEGLIRPLGAQRDFKDLMRTFTTATEEHEARAAKQQGWRLLPLVFTGVWVYMFWNR